MGHPAAAGHRAEGLVDDRAGPLPRVRPFPDVLVQGERRVGVPEDELHGPDVRALVDQQGREVAPEAVRPHLWRDADRASQAA